MAVDKRITELPVATTPLAGTEKAEIVQGGVNKQVDVSEFGSGGTSTPYGATTGTNTYSATMSPVVSAYTDGQMYHIRVSNSSTGLVTIDLGPGDKKAFDTSGAQIQDGYLKAGVDYVIVYNSTLDAAAGGFTVVNEVIHGFMNLRATYTTGTGLWPSTGGSGPSSGIRHGDTFIAGSNMTLGAKVVNTGDFITTMVDAPGQTDASWYVIPGPASLAKKIDAILTIKTKTASHTLDADDLTDANLGKALNFIMDVAAPNDFTIPPNSTRAFQVGTQILVDYTNTGATSFIAGSGVTIQSADGLTIAARYKGVVAKKIATDTWLLQGALTT